jgi:hypothetical protein
MVCTGGCATWLALPIRHAAPRVAVAATTLVVGLVLGGLAVGATYVRSSPESSLLVQVRQLTPPRGSADDETTYGTTAPGPWDARGFAAELVATAADQNVDWSPAAVRSWRGAGAQRCTQTATVARDWADAGSVRALSDKPGMACEWSADRHGWQALVEVVDAPWSARTRRLCGLPSGDSRAVVLRR